MRFALPALVLLWSLPALAGSVRATLDRSHASLDDEVTLTLTIVGDSEDPELPNALRADFDVGSSGHASQVSIVNGRMSSSTRYTFSLSPKRIGTLTIPAIPVTVDGTRLATEPLQLVVSAADVQSRRNDDLYVTAELVPAIAERTTAYVGEQLIYTVRVYARVNANCPGLQLPEMSGADSYELGSQRQFRTRVDGDELSVVELKRAVFPTKAGELEIPAMRLSCTIERQNRRGTDDFGTFFGGAGVRRTIRSNATRLHVEALPPAPPGFSGLVGDVSVRASLSKSDAQRGDSVTLSLTVKGTADMSRASEPTAELGDLKVYDDKPMSRFDTGGSALIGERTFQKALVPQSSGDVVIKVEGVTYFDPRTERYAQADAPTLTLHVSGGEAAAAAQPRETTSRATVEAPAVTPQGASAFALRNSGHTSFADWLHGWRLILLLGAPLGVAIIVRTYGARPSQRRRDAHIEDALETLRATTDPGDIAKVIRTLIRTRSGHTGTLTNDEAIAALAATGASTAAVERIRTVLATCEAATYGSAAVAAPMLRDDAAAAIRVLGGAT